ncbi:MAG: hypothetical protein H6555_00800 [Lewinellaceae bacterium]|nr:hypothetical protein [Lewinellaceae bacterium]
MNERHSIDDHFRQRLYDHQYDPPMHLWEGLAAKRQPVAAPSAPASKRWPWLALLVLFSSVATWWLLHEKPEGNPQETTVIAIQQNSQPSSPAKGSVTVPSQAIVPLVRIDKITSVANKEVAPAVAQGGKPSPVIQPPAAKSGNAKGLSTSIAPTITATAPAGQPLTELFVETGKATGDIGEMGVAEEIKAKEAARTWSSLHQFAAPTISAFPFRLRIYDEILTSRFRQRNWYAKMDLLVSYDQQFRQLTPMDTRYANYAQLRNQSEAQGAAYSTTLRFGLIAKNGFSIRSGINWSRYTETATFDLVENPQGPAKRTNTFQTVDIPVLIGFERSLGRVNVGLNVGTYLNMAFNQSGEFYAPNGKSLVSFSSNNQDAYPAFKNRLGAGYYGSLAIGYDLKPGLELLLEPHYRAFPHSVTAPDYALTQRYHTWGVFLGVRKQIGSGFAIP